MKNRTLNLIPVSKMTHKKKYKKILKTKETGKKRGGGGEGFIKFVVFPWLNKNEALFFQRPNCKEESFWF